MIAAMMPNIKYNLSALLYSNNRDITEAYFDLIFYGALYNDSLNSGNKVLVAFALLISSYEHLSYCLNPIFSFSYEINWTISEL